MLELWARRQAATLSSRAGDSSAVILSFVSVSPFETLSFPVRIRVGARLSLIQALISDRPRSEQPANFRASENARRRFIGGPTGREIVVRFREAVPARPLGGAIRMSDV